MTVSFAGYSDSALTNGWACRVRSSELGSGSAPLCHTFPPHSRGPSYRTELQYPIPLPPSGVPEPRRIAMRMYPSGGNTTRYRRELVTRSVSVLLQVVLICCSDSLAIVSNPRSGVEQVRPRGRERSQNGRWGKRGVTRNCGRNRLKIVSRNGKARLGGEAGVFGNAAKYTCGHHGAAVRRPDGRAPDEGSTYIHGHWTADWDQTDCKPWYQAFQDAVGRYSPHLHIVAGLTHIRDIQLVATAPPPIESEFNRNKIGRPCVGALR